MKLHALLFVTAAALLAADHQEIPLWSGDAPGSEGITTAEKVEPPAADRAFTRVSNIHRPSITVYLSPAGKANGAAVIIAPGGGHRMLAMHEGYDIGEWLASKGVAGFVLKYRLAREEGSKYTVEQHALADAQRAIRMVRSRAAEWKIDPARVGIMGFSAGGEVALLASLRFDAGNAASTDPVERFGSRPDFQALIYPGIRNVALEAISKNTPPAFLICAHDDKSPAERIPNVYLAMLKAEAPAELHIYARGGHGYGIRNRPLPVSSWPARFEEWMADQGFLSPRQSSAATTR